MQDYIKQAYIRIGRSVFEFNEKLNIQELDNGYVFKTKFYKTLEEIMPDLLESLKQHFK